MTTTFVGHFLGPNSHASRPAAAGLPEGTMYVCTTHNKIERVVSAAWVDYATLGSGVTVSTDGIWDSKGDLAAATGADAAAKVTVGTNGQVLTADSAQTAGVKWAAPGSVATDTLFDAKGDLAAASGADTAARLPVGTDGQILTADSAQTLGVKWSAAPSGGILATLFDAKGDLIAASANDTAARLPVGTDGQVLTADSAQTLGVKWAAAATGGASFTVPAWTSGNWYGRQFAQGASAASVGSGDMHVVPVWVPGSYTLNAIGFLGNTGTANVRLGIYNDTGSGFPGTLLLDAGTVANASGARTITISQAITQGLYWLAIASQGASNSIYGFTGPRLIESSPTMGDYINGNGGAGYSRTGITAALPSPYGSTRALVSTAATMACYVKPA